MSRLYSHKPPSVFPEPIPRVYDHKSLPQFPNSMSLVYNKSTTTESTDSISQDYEHKPQLESSDSMSRVFNKKSPPKSSDSMPLIYIQKIPPESSQAIYQDPKSLPGSSLVSSQHRPRWSRIHRGSAHTESLLGRFLPVVQDTSPGTTTDCGRGAEVRDQFTQRVTSVKVEETTGDISYLRNHLGLCLPTEQQVLQWTHSGPPVSAYPWHYRVARTQVKLKLTQPREAVTLVRPRDDQIEQSMSYKRYQEEIRTRQEVEEYKSMQYSFLRRQQCELRRRCELRELDQILKKIEVEVNKNKNMESHWRRLACKHSDMKLFNMDKLVPESKTTKARKTVVFIDESDNRNQSRTDGRLASGTPTHPSPPKDLSTVPLLATLGRRKVLASVDWKKGVFQT